MLQRHDEIFKLNVKDVGAAESLARANDRAGLPFRAVNAEQTAPGKASPNDRPSHGKNKGSSAHGNAIHHCMVMLYISREKERENANSAFS